MGQQNTIKSPEINPHYMVGESLTKEARIHNGKKSLQQMVLGKLDSNIQTNETGPLSYTTHKNKLKMD